MLARHAVLLTLPSDGNRPSWSYHHTGTLPRLISFVSRPYANTGGGGVFFPFWYKTIGGGDANSLHYSSSFFSHSCALFCAFLHFPRIQPFSFQSFPHSSPKNTPGGGTLRLLCPLLPCSIANLTLHAFSRWPELANRPGRLFQPFPFNLQLWTLNLLFVLLPMGHGARITPFSLPPYFVPFLTSFFHYNRCASIRGTNEFQPASRRDTNRLRAPLLGRQHHGNLRAPILLRRLRLPRQLSTRKVKFPHRANRHAHRNLRRHGRPPRFPSRALAGLPDSGCRLFPARLHRRAVARSGKGRHSPRNFCGIHPDSACVGHLDGQALRGGNNGPRLQGKRPLHRLLHLLHHGEHRRRLRPLCCLLGPPPPRRRKRFPCRSPQRLCHVLRRPSFLPRAEMHRRRSPAEHRRNASEFFHRSLQPQVHVVSADLHRLLDCFLAAVHHAPRLHSRLHQRRCRRRAHPDYRRPRRNLSHTAHQLPHPQNTRIPVCYSGHAHHLSILVDRRFSAHHARRG